MDYGEVACSSLVVSCCKSLGAFEFVEAALNLISQSIDEAINWNDLLSIGLGWNDRCPTALFDIASDMDTATRPVSDSF